MTNSTKVARLLALLAALTILPTNACVTDSSLYVGGLLAANFSYTHVLTLELITCLPAEVVVNSVATITRIDKKTGAVVKVFREQTLTTYAPLGDNKMLVNFDIADFDMQGQRLFASKCVCTETRVQPMQIVNQDDRGDLRGMFREFLRAHALSELLPSR